MQYYDEEGGDDEVDEDVEASEQWWWEMENIYIYVNTNYRTLYCFK